MGTPYRSPDQSNTVGIDRRHSREYRQGGPTRSNAVDHSSIAELTRRGHSDGILGDGHFVDRAASQTNILPSSLRDRRSVAYSSSSRNVVSIPTNRDVQQPNVDSFSRRRRSSTALHPRHSQQRSISDLNTLTNDTHPLTRNSATRGAVPMDLHTRPLPSLPGSEASASPSPRPLKVPKWQPDDEICNCPICGTSFTFWYRKHHCRKCGRVVCATCSPHRITIPRQFIVRPPGDITAAPRVTPPGAEVIDLTNEDGSASASDTEGRLQEHNSDFLAGAGEEVRLCNPCVPDPNPLPFQTSFESAFNLPTGAYTNRILPPLNDGLTWRPDSTLNETRRPRSSFPNSDRRQPAHHNPYPEGAFYPMTLPHGMSGRSAMTGQNGSSLLDHPRTAFGSAPDQSHQRYLENMLHRHRSSFQHHRHHASLGQPSFSRPFSRPISSLNEASTQALQPQRPLSEEDECPICHGALPARTPDGSETAREQHIVSCIEAHSSSAKAGSHSQAMAAGDGTNDAAAPTQTHASRAEFSTSFVERSSSLTQQRRRTTGMVVYNATEKDCQTETGTGDAECVICFEEFAVGDEMGRLECLCKFHSKCIRQWWEAKGPGICPVHQQTT